MHNAHKNQYNTLNTDELELKYLATNKNEKSITNKPTLRERVSI